MADGSATRCCDELTIVLPTYEGKSEGGGKGLLFGVVVDTHLPTVA